MAKKKRTLKEKKLADTKKVHSVSGEMSSASSPSQIDVPQESPYVFKMKVGSKIAHTKHQAVTSVGYDFFKHDLAKTAILTTSIVIAQLVLYHIIR